MISRKKSIAIVVTTFVLGGAALASVAYFEYHDDFDGIDRWETTEVGNFDFLDADGDGALTQSEINTQRQSQLARHDTDSNGVLSTEEFARLWHEEMEPVSEMAFQSLDADANGVVTRAEFELPFAEIVQQLDSDNNGSITMLEYHGGDGRDDWQDDN